MFETFLQKENSPQDNFKKNIKNDYYDKDYLFKKSPPYGIRTGNEKCAIVFGKTT